MIKKVLFIVLALATSLSLLVMPVYASESNDPRIAIEVVRDGSKLTINHTSGLSLTHAVIEYAYMEENQKYAKLTTLNVVNNIVNIDASWIAIKVHQVKVLKDRVYYTYMTENQNTIGSFANVTRLNVTEIQTVQTKKINTSLRIEQFGGWQENHKYYEFYFKFDKAHDELLGLKVDYILSKKEGMWWWEKIVKENVTRTFVKWLDQTIHGYTKYADIWVGSTQTIKTLEANTNKDIDANYVLRIAPSGTEGFTIKDYQNYDLENMAIIQITYIHQGEFIVDDVINNPTTPIDDDFKWFFDVMEQIKGWVEWLQNLDWQNALTWIIGIAILIFSIPLIFILIALIKLIVGITKFAFKMPGRIGRAFKSFGRFLKWLIIPKKKKRRT